MKLVIDISEESYERIKYMYIHNNSTASDFKNIIEKGVPLTEKTGRWILTVEDWNKWTCSECGYYKRTDIHVSLGWKYCPNCGAKMGVEE